MAKANISFTLETNTLSYFLRNIANFKRAGIELEFNKSSLRDFISFVISTNNSSLLLELINDKDIASYMINIAAEKGEYDTVNALIQAGVDVNYDDNQSDETNTRIQKREKVELSTPIAKAAENNHTNIVELLIKNGAVISDINNTVLLNAIKNDNTDIIMLLLDNGADINFSNNEAIMLAIQKGCLNVAKLLIEKEGDIETNGTYYLKKAIENSQIEIADFLLKKKVVVDNDCYTSVIRACRNGDLDIIKLIAESGNYLKENGEDFLDEATEYGNFELVKYLTEYGIKPTNFTLSLATTYEHTEIADFLNKVGIVDSSSDDYFELPE